MFQTHPWVIIELPSEEEAKKICSRSISTKICAHLWTQSDKGWSDLHQNIAKYCQQNIKQFGPDISFKMHMEAFMKKLSMEERLQRIESFSYMPVQGPVKLHDPDVTFVNFEFHGMFTLGSFRKDLSSYHATFNLGLDHNNLPEAPEHLFFGQLVAEGQRDLITR